MTTHPRTVVLSRHPRRHIANREFDFLICPGDIAARQLGFPPLSLDEIARQSLEANGFTIAPEHVVLRIVASILTRKLKSEDCSGMARALLPAINTLFRSGADLEPIARRVGGRPQLIGQTALALREYLFENGYSAKADAITAAVQNRQEAITAASAAQSPGFKLPTIPRMAVFGYPRLIEMEYRLIDLIAGPGSRVYLPYQSGDKLFDDNESAARFFAGRGWQIEQAEDAAGTPGQRAGDAFLGLVADLAGVAAASYPNIEEEVRAVLRGVKRSLLAGEFAVEDVALVARTESSYGEWVREIAWEYGLPVVTHYSVSLLETRAGQWLSGLMEICETADFPFEATARLFQHALGGALRGDALSAANWAEARRDHAQGAAQWRQLGLLMESISWPAEEARGDWCDRVRAMLRDLQIRELSMRRPQDLLAFEKLYEALQDFSLPRGELLSRAELIAQLRDLLRVTTVPSHTSSAGIEVHTPLSLYGAAVKHVFVLGEAEGELPRPIADDAMLDFHDRKLLADEGLVRLESAAQAARRETLSFYSLLLAAEESLSFSYPRMDGSSAVRPSPFLSRIGAPVIHHTSEISIAASRSELLRYEMQHADAPDTYVERARLASGVVLQREQNRTYDEYNGLLGIPRSAEDHLFSPSQLNTFGQCPYHWFAQKLLKLGDPEEAEDDLAANLKGSLYHEVLNRLLTRCKDTPDVRAAMLAELESTFDEVANGMTELTRIAGWRGRRFELMAQLKKAIGGKDFLAEGSVVLASEKSLRGEWNGLQVAGRLDRMDRTPKGLLVIDYKTSGSMPKGAKDENDRLKLDVQLPVYLALAGKEAAASGYYYSLTRGEMLGKEVCQGDVEGLQRLAIGIRSSLEEGLYPVAPDENGEACQYCELDVLCRKGPYLFRNQEEEQ